MKHFMIKYQLANGTTEEWHRVILPGIAADESAAYDESNSCRRRQKHIAARDIDGA